MSALRRVAVVLACLMGVEWPAIRFGRGAIADDAVRPTREDFVFTVELLYLSPERVVEKCRALGAWAGRAVPSGYVGGCNAFYLDRKHCVIIAPRPRFVDDRATTVAGHELTHCALGRYHYE